ncbi:MAG: envelope stress response membrane protein PspC [Aeromonas sp.]
MSERKLYRDPLRGKLAGTCAGVAHYLGVEVWLVRLLAVSGLIFAGFITLTAYLAAWFLLDKRAPEPAAEPRMKQRGWQSGLTSAQSMRELSASFDALEPRLAKLEQVITSREFHLAREFNRL